MIVNPLLEARSLSRKYINHDSRDHKVQSWTYSIHTADQILEYPLIRMGSNAITYLLTVRVGNLSAVSVVVWIAYTEQQR